MKPVHNESGDCSCASCINKSESSRTSLKRMIRIGSRANKLHYGTELPSKDKKLLDRLVATRKKYDKLRSEILTTSSGDPGGQDTEDDAVVDIVKLVDKGEASEHNPLGECCSCCICESLRAKRARKRRRRCPARARSGRSEYSSRSSAVSRHKGPRCPGEVHFDAKRVHSDPCTCTLKLSRAIKRRSREAMKKIRRHEKSTESVGEKVRRPNRYMQKIKHSESRMRQTLKNEARRSMKAMRASKTRFQQNNPDISSEVIRVAREKNIIQSQVGRKGRARKKNRGDLDDSGEQQYSRKMKAEVRKSAKKIAGLVQDSKTRLRESVETFAHKSVEKIKNFETKRKLGHHMCDCPEVAAELTKMAKQNLNRQKLPPGENFVMDNEAEKALDESVMPKVKVGVRKSAEHIGKSLRENINAVALKSAQKIKQLDAKRKIIRSICECRDKIGMAKKSLTRRKKESLEKISQLKETINTEVKKSSEKLSDQIKGGVKRLSQQIHPLQTSHKTTTENKKGFRIRKDSKTKYREALVKKKELKDWECDPPCFPEECEPEECYEKILLRNDKLNRKHKSNQKDAQQIMEKSLGNLSGQLDSVHSQVNDQSNRKGKHTKNKAIKTLSATSGGTYKGTSHDLVKKESTGKAIATAKPTVTLKVGSKKKKSSNSSCQCEKTKAKPKSVASIRSRESKPVMHELSISTQENLKKKKQTSVPAKKNQTLTKRTKKSQFRKNSVTSHTSNTSTMFDEKKIKKTEIKRKPEKEKTSKSEHTEDVNEEAGARRVVRISSSFGFEIEFSKDISKLKANEMRPRHERSQANLDTQRVVHQRVKQTQKTGRIRPSSVSISKATKTRRRKYDVVHHRSSSTSTGQMRSASSLTPRSPRAPHKGAQVPLKKKEYKVKAGCRSGVRIGSTFNFNVEFYKDNQSVQKEARVHEPPCKTTCTPEKSTSVEMMKVNKLLSFDTKKFRTRNKKEENKSVRSYRSSFSEKSNVTLLKNNLKRCICDLKSSKQKKLKKKALSRGTFISDQSYMHVLKSSGTGTKERKVKLLPYECEPGYCIAGECDPYDCQLEIRRRELKYKSKCCGTFNRRTRSTSSFTSRSVTSPKNKQVQSVGLIRKNKKKAINNNVPKVVTSYPGSPRRQAVRIGSNFGCSIEFSKENASESPVRCLNYNNHKVECKKKSLVKRKGSQGDGNVQKQQKCIQYKSMKMGTKGTRMQELSEDRSSQAMGARRINRGTVSKPMLKRCFCTLNLPTRGKNHHNKVSRQHNYTVGRLTVENKKNATTVLTTTPPEQQVRSQLCQSACKFSELSESNSLSIINSLTGLPLKEFIDLKYFNMVKNTSICLLPKANYSRFSFTSFKSLLTFSSSYILGNTLLNSKKGNLIKNRSLYATRSQSLKRCYCTFDLQGPLKKRYNNKYQFKSSGCNLGICAPSNDISRASQKQVNNKSKQSNHTKHSASNVFFISPPDKHIIYSEAQLSSRHSKLGISPFTVRQTVYRQALLPYECEPNMCVPGECDPYECLKLVKKRTKDGITQSNAALRHSASTKSNVVHMNEDLQTYRERAIRYHHRNHGSNASSNETSLTTVSPTRQAVRISSNFKLNVEFFKDTVSNSVPERREEVGRQVPITRDTRTRGITMKQRSRHSGSQSLKRHQHRHSQMEHVVGERSTINTSVLKRCFCTAKLLGHKMKPQPVQKYKEKKIRPQKNKSQTGTSTKKYKEMKIRPQKNASETGTTSSTKKYKEMKIRPQKETSETGSPVAPKLHRTKSILKKFRCFIKNMRFRKKQYTHTNSLDLDSNECEPGFCVPGDPYVGLERIKKRKYDSGDTEMRNKKSKAVLHKSYETPRAQKIKTIAFRDNASAMTEISSSYEKPDRQRHRQIPRRESETEQVNTGRQAEKIGSNFSFSVEFFKDSSQLQETVPVIVTPVHTENIKTSKPYRRRTRTTFAPRVGSVSINHGTSDMNVTNSKKIQSMINTASTLALNKKDPLLSVNIPQDQKNQMKRLSHDSLRSTQTALGTFLKRCQCILKFKKEKRNIAAASTKIHEHFLPNINIHDTLSRSTHCRERGTKSNLKRHMLKPYECEPNICIPGECDPYECYERIQQRLKTTCSKCCGNNPPKSCDKCIKTVAYENRSAYTHPDREKKRSEEIQADRMKRGAERDHNVHKKNRDNVGQRQAVEIGSNFSFNVEFLKDNQQGNECNIVQPIDAENFKQEREDPVIKQRTIETSTRKTDRGAGEYRRDYRNADSQIFYETENTESGAERMLKRCFCTLTLQQQQSHRQSVIRSKYPNIQRVYNFETASTKTSTKKRKLHDLKPYECEPGFCVPGECNPYECLERIKKRNVRSTGTRTPGRQSVAASCMASCTPTKGKGINALCKGERSNMVQQQCTKQTQQRAVVEVPRFTNVFGKRNIQSVKIGSNFSFNIEFFKEVTPVQAKHTNDSCKASPIQKPKIKPPCYADDGVCTTSRGTRNRSVSHRATTCHDQCQMASVRTESKCIGVGKVLKRCFCTLKFQNQTPPSKYKRMFTVGRVAIEEERRNYFKGKHKFQLPDKINQNNSSIEMKTIYPYKPKKFRAYKSKTLLQNSNQHKVRRIMDPPTSRMKILSMNDSVTKQRNHFKKRQTPRVKNYRGEVDNMKKSSSSPGNHRFLHHFISFFSRETKILPNTESNLPATKNSHDKKLYAPTTPKLPKQRKNNYPQNKGHKSSKSDRQSKKHGVIPTKKSKSLKTAKLTGKKLIQKQHLSDRRDHYSHHQSGDARQLRTFNAVSVSKDQTQYKSANFQGKPSPYSKNYLVGYSLKSNETKSVNQWNQVCDECQSCTMMGCDCFERRGQGLCSCKQKFKKCDCKTIFNTPVCPVKGQTKTHKLKLRAPPIVDSQETLTVDAFGHKPNPLFVVQVDPSDCSVVNREETIQNMNKWNSILLERSAYRRGWRKQKCVCGSKVCKKERKKITEKIGGPGDLAWTIKPCVCGSKVCAHQSEQEAVDKMHEEKFERKRKVKAKAKIEKAKKKKIAKKKEKVIKYNKRKKKKQQEEEDTLVSTYTKAEKLRHKRHMKKIKHLDAYTKKQEGDPDTLLISESIVDVADLTKFWIKTLARRLYRIVKHPQQSYRALQIKKKEHGFNTTELVTKATYTRVKRRLAFTTYFHRAANAIAANQLGYLLMHLTDRKVKKTPDDFRPPRPITEAKRAAKCNVFFSTLRRKRCLWVYDRWPWFYPHCISMLQVWKQFCDVLTFLLAVIVWSPCILCVEICRGCMCCTFCTQ